MRGRHVVMLLVMIVLVAAAFLALLGSITLNR
jgi:hypothetical protein